MQSANVWMSLFIGHRQELTRVLSTQGMEPSPGMEVPQHKMGLNRCKLCKHTCCLELTSAYFPTGLGYILIFIHSNIFFKVLTYNVK